MFYEKKHLISSYFQLTAAKLTLCKQLKLSNNICLAVAYFISLFSLFLFITMHQKENKWRRKMKGGATIYLILLFSFIIQLRYFYLTCELSFLPKEKYLFVHEVTNKYTFPNWRTVFFFFLFHQTYLSFYLFFKWDRDTKYVPGRKQSSAILVILAIFKELEETNFSKRLHCLFIFQICFNCEFLTIVTHFTSLWIIMPYELLGFCVLLESVGVIWQIA